MSELGPPTSVPSSQQDSGNGEHASDRILSIRNVTKRWPRQPLPVLNDICMQLQGGELAWLTGENGAGKTTLLRMVAGIVAPDAGEITVCGIDLGTSRRAYQQHIGVLTAGNSGLYARMTVRQHLDYWARLAFVPATERPARVESAMQTFALSTLAGRRVDRMSMGQRQRVRIAMAFLHRPTLVLLDEPMNSLDDEGAATLTEAVAKHVLLGSAAIWCSPGGAAPACPIQHEFRLVSGQLQRA